MPPDDPPDWQVCEWYWPWARIRQRVTAERGVPTYFAVQLEYDHAASLDGRKSSDWHQVARFDHEHNSPHDWRFDQPHMDVYRGGEKEYIQLFNKLPVTAGMDFARSYLADNHEEILRDYERWHDLPQRFG